MRFLNVIFPKTKFQRDIGWNALTFAAMGISGTLLNILLVMKYGAEILGVFNQVYAVYILISHLSVFGLYASVLKHVSEYSEDGHSCSQILISSLCIGFAAASLVSLVYYVAAPLVGSILDSPLVAKGMIFSSIGLWCLSINKILLAFLNGKGELKAFAIFSAFRYLLMPLSLAVLIFLGLPGYIAPIIFTLTESILLIGLLIFCLRFFSLASASRCRKWFKIHLSFGGKTLIGGAISDMNTRVDVLMLGGFFGDKLVGIYSLAAMLAEGFDQIPVIFKVNYNPLLAKLIVKKRLEELSLMIRNFLKKWFPISLGLGFLAVLVFPSFVKIISDDPELLNGWFIFAVLIAGMVARSGYSVFGDLPSQAGHPGHQTLLIFFVAGSNIILNYFFIQQWGLYGAAIATSLSFIFGIFYLKIIVKKILGIAI